MSEYFLKRKFLRANVKVQLNLSNYATKSDLRNEEMLIHCILLKKLI